MKNQICTFSELQTVFFEVAQIINQRPIGRKPSSPDEETYLFPNDLLLGRNSNVVPQGPFDDQANIKNRYKFFQAIVYCFWRRWQREIFPSLVLEPKWHVEKRNVKIGDVVLFQESNAMRGEWKMALVSEATAREDGRVRKVLLTYKNGKTNVTISRAVQKLILLVPTDDELLL